VDEVVNLKDFDTFFSSIILPTDIRDEEDHKIIDAEKKHCLLSLDDKGMIKSFVATQLGKGVKIDFDFTIPFEVAKILHKFYQYENLKNQKVDFEAIRQNALSIIKVIVRDEGDTPVSKISLTFIVAVRLLLVCRVLRMSAP
jgi:hypothetical protein